MSKPCDATMLAHSVYFSLHDRSAEAIDTLVADCHEYLRDHPGVEFFAAGTLVADLDRDVNQRDFDVALLVVFSDRAAHDVYQQAEAHLEFIRRNRENWRQVRVFDAHVAS